MSLCRTAVSTLVTSVIFSVNPFQSSVIFRIETSYLFFRANQMNDFYMKYNTKLKWVNLTILKSSIKTRTRIDIFATNIFLLKTSFYLSFFFFPCIIVSQNSKNQDVISILFDFKIMQVSKIYLKSLVSISKISIPSVCEIDLQLLLVLHDLLYFPWFIEFQQRPFYGIRMRL